MDRSNRLLRFVHAADTALSFIILPIVIIGAASTGHIDAALTFAGMLVGGFILYRAFARRS
jgi:hypothetical protein